MDLVVALAADLVVEAAEAVDLEGLVVEASAEVEVAEAGRTVGMYRKDLITAEIEKLAQVLARIMGLKLDSKLAEAAVLFNETMEKDFGLDSLLLSGANNELFKNWLNTSSLSPEKLDSLSEFLYYELGTSEEKNKLIAPRLNLIYEQLSTKHKIVHLVNLHRQKTIQQYL